MADKHQSDSSRVNIMKLLATLITLTVFTTFAETTTTTNGEYFGVL